MASTEVSTTVAVDNAEERACAASAAGKKRPAEEEAEEEEGVDEETSGDGESSSKRKSDSKIGTFQRRKRARPVQRITNLFLLRRVENSSFDSSEEDSATDDSSDEDGATNSSDKKPAEKVEGEEEVEDEKLGDGRSSLEDTSDSKIGTFQRRKIEARKRMRQWCPSETSGETKKLSDEDLFKTPPQYRGDCPICFLPLPTANSYQACCGKVVCGGCMQKVAEDDYDYLCPFCRAPASHLDDSFMERTKKRMAKDDPVAFYMMGSYYCDEAPDLDHKKAIELWLHAGKLGLVEAYNKVGILYQCGRGVDKDEEMAIYYYQLAAVGGYEAGRHNLGLIEEKRGNIIRAMKHYMISAEAGFKLSMNKLMQGFKDGHINTDDFLRVGTKYVATRKEMGSVNRSKAAAVDVDQE